MPKTYLVLDGKLIKLKPNTNPTLYRAIHTATRLLKKELQHATSTSTLSQPNQSNSGSRPK